MEEFRGPTPKRRRGVGAIALLVVASVVVLVFLPRRDVGAWDILSVVRAGDRASEAVKAVTVYTDPLTPAALLTASKVINAEYLVRDCRAVDGLFRNSYSYQGVAVEPGTDCDSEVELQRSYGKLWLVAGSRRILHSGCENVEEYGDKPTIRASECLSFDVVGHSGLTYPGATTTLVLGDH